jgi:hypothetical protein
MNAARSARNQASLINRTNVGGGPKKAGIVPRIGFFMQSNPTLRRGQQRVPLFTINYRIIQTQKYGYSAVHGGNMG